MLVYENSMEEILRKLDLVIVTNRQERTSFLGVRGLNQLDLEIIRMYLNEFRKTGRINLSMESRECIVDVMGNIEKLLSKGVEA